MHFFKKTVVTEYRKLNEVAGNLILIMILITIELLSKPNCHFAQIFSKTLDKIQVWLYLFINPCRKMNAELFCMWNARRDRIQIECLDSI